MAPPPPDGLAELSLEKVDVVTASVSALPSVDSKSMAPPLLLPAESLLNVQPVTERSPPCWDMPPPGEFWEVPTTVLEVMASFVRLVLSPLPPADMPAPLSKGVVVALVAPPVTVTLLRLNVIPPAPRLSTAKTC